MLSSQCAETQDEPPGIQIPLEQICRIVICDPRKGSGLSKLCPNESINNHFHSRRGYNNSLFLILMPGAAARRL